MRLSVLLVAACAAAFAVPASASPLTDLMDGKTAAPQSAAQKPAAGNAALGALIVKYSKITPVQKDYKGIWDDVQFQGIIAQIIGKDRMKTLYKRWGKSGLLEMNPILDEQSVGMKGIYQTEANKPHDADENLISVYFNPKSNTYQIYWRQTEVPGGTPKEVVWFASGRAPIVLRPNDPRASGGLKANNVLGW